MIAQRADSALLGFVPKLIHNLCPPSSIFFAVISAWIRPNEATNRMGLNEKNTPLQIHEGLNKTKQNQGNVGRKMKMHSLV